MGYCTRADIETRFGAVNVRKWADLDNSDDDAAITARISAAIAQASADIDDELRGGAVDVPISGAAPSAIVEICAVYAAVWMYSARGYEDSQSDEPSGRLAGVRARAAATLADIRHGVRILSGLTIQTGTVPAAYKRGEAGDDWAAPYPPEAPTVTKYPSAAAVSDAE